MGWRELREMSGCAKCVCSSVSGSLGLQMSPFQPHFHTPALLWNGGEGDQNGTEEARRPSEETVASVVRLRCHSQAAQPPSLSEQLSHGTRRSCRRWADGALEKSSAPSCLTHTCCPLGECVCFSPVLPLDVICVCQQMPRGNSKTAQVCFWCATCTDNEALSFCCSFGFKRKRKLPSRKWCLSVKDVLLWLSTDAARGIFRFLWHFKQSHLEICKFKDFVLLHSADSSADSF